MTMALKSVPVVSLAIAVIVAASSITAQALITQANSGSTVSANAFTVSSTDLINQGRPTLAGQSSSGFVNEFNSGDPTVLNDGTMGGNVVITDTAGSDSTFTATYTLNLSPGSSGYKINEIDVYTGWQGGRSDPTFQVYYTTVTNPTPQELGGTFTYGSVTDSLSSSEVALTNIGGGPLSDGTNTLAGVATLQFTLLVSPINSEGALYREIDVFGQEFVPEPASVGMLALGGLLLLKRRRSH